MRRLNLIGLVLIGLLAALPVVDTGARQAAAPASAKATTGLAGSASFAAARKDAEIITAEKMRKDLYWIADDARAGRDTPSPGLDETARYIADRLRSLKVKPAGGDGTYFQKIVLRSTEVDRAKTTASLGGRTFKVGEGFLPSGRASGEAEGQVVFAGHGWVVGSKNINAYEGLDVRDRIVVVTGDGRRPPPGVAEKEITDSPAATWESPISYAQKNGARAIVFVPRNFERRWRAGQNTLTRPEYYPARLQEESDEALDLPPVALPAIIPSREMLDALFAGETADGAAVLKAATAGESLKGFALSQPKRLRLALSLKVSEVATQNVVGVVEGRDSRLKREYVALGAHYDHVGVGRAVGGDSIYNGADDDGSGTTALLALAEAFSKGKRPARSILFVWHAGEEKGLWGSEYFAKFPTVPLEQVVTQLNIDMIGRSKRAGDTNPKNRMLTGPEEIYVIGSKMMSTELGELSEAVNAAYLGIRFNYHYDQPNDPERLFYRSDHYNYARNGVPIIFYFDGIHEDYHQPSDHADKIDYQKMERVTRTIFITASELANRPTRPVVDKQLSADRLGR
ncbi:MAG TPA: M28 family peptidase [Pyrinomonadaceae bacterium]|nr:M28 family peptidase [Pyrinomonadaceae bacterium]